MLAGVRVTLRQPRYASLAVAMLFVAAACVTAGTFEIHRYGEKRAVNQVLRSNYHAAPAAIAAVVPLAGAGRVAQIRYRTVRLHGRYQASRQQYLAGQNQDGQQGFDVVTPFRTAGGVVLTVRGFVAADASGRRPSTVEAPPSATVTVLARLAPASSASDQLGVLGDGEIASVNATQQAARLHEPVFDAVATLKDGQPGRGGLDGLPGPDLSNPSGGAGEVQLLSYVVQWYAFALLALSAPFFFRRAEIKQARAKFLGIDPSAEQFDDALALPGGRTGSGELVVRSAAELATRPGPGSVEWRRAARVADRYGLSLGDEPRSAERAPAARRRAVPREQGLTDRAVVSSASTPHRAIDEHHGAYNDYLWELALADGDIELGPAPDEPAAAAPPVIDIEPGTIGRPPER